MLPLPNLDNENFEDIFLDARRQIPGITSEWTDFNYHDPGITLLQLLAWLKEMQQFYIDGIGDVHRLKYLKLLNYSPYKTKSAAANVSISGINNDIQLLKGMKFSANGIIFEASRNHMLLGNAIKCMQYVKGSRYVDISHVIDGNGAVGISEYMFGQKPACGDSFMIGFEKELPVAETIDIYAQLFYEKSVSRNPVNNEVYPLAVLKWEYWSEGEWREIILQRDETYGFIKDGFIQLAIDSKMTEEVFGGCCQKLYWIRCTILKCNYDLAPRLANLTINMVEVSQRDTKCEILNIANGLLDNTYLSLYGGNNEIQISCGRGLWEKYEGTLKASAEDHVHKQSFLEDIQNNSRNDMRIICRSGEEAGYIIGSSTGYPAQNFDIPFENILEDDIRIQVGIFEDSRILWQDWTRTEDLLTRSMEDQCFELDLKNNIIKFGDGMHGAIPSRGTDNIRIISCATSLGIRGNVKNEEINSIASEDEKLLAYFETAVIHNAGYADGGRNSESIDDAVQRFRKDFSRVSRAITCQDYETLVMETPGLIIQKAHAIPNYKKGIGYLENGSDSNCITLAVKAYSDQTPLPELNEAYMKNIKNHINGYRLVTTEVEIISPCYIGIDVFCSVQGKPYYKDIKNILNNFFMKEFDAINGKRNFGQDIEYGDIYGKIESLDCIKKVIGLTLDTHAAGVVKKPGGGIQIPPDGLTYLRQLEIEIKE